MPPSSSPVDALQKFSIPLAILIAGLFIAGAVYFAGDKTGAGAPQPARAVNIKDVRVTADTPYIGQKNAPVTLAYWYDYQCPFCKAIDVGGVEGINIDPSMPTLVKDYVNTGKLRIVFKDYAFLGSDSTVAALYEHALWAMYPDTFFEWHEAMYEAQDEENGGFGDEASILALIGTMQGLDAAKLKSLVAKDKDKYLAVMQADQQEGAAFGITGTPAFITGTELISGAQQPAVLIGAIDRQLK